MLTDGVPVDTSLPSAIGTAQDGTALTASPGSWNGATPMTFAYQWQGCDASGSNCSNIQSATNSSYTLTHGDVGHTLRVTVNATNNPGTSAATSAQTGVVQALPPSNSGGSNAPAISGTDQDGSTLTASPGSWSGSTPLTYGYQWETCNTSGSSCSNISGATSSTYTLQHSDVNTTLRIVVTASNATLPGGGTSSATSAQTPVVQPTPPANTSLPGITGTPNDGQTLTASTGTWSGTPPITYAYQWQDCDANGNNCSNIAAATGSTYQLRSADVGSTIRVGVTASNGGGSTSATSGQTSLVQGIAPASTALPTTSGTAQDTQTLTTTNGTWSGTTPMTFTYQWESCDTLGNNCSGITGANTQTYTLTSNQVGNTIRVAVTAHNSAGSSTAVSAQTGIVQAVPPSNSTAPAISGVQRVGQTLTTTQGFWAGSTPLTYTYQWQRCTIAGVSCANIAGATSSAYTLTDDDANSTIRSSVTASNAPLPGGGTSTASSAPTSRIDVLFGAGMLSYFAMDGGPLDDRMTFGVNLATGNLHLDASDVSIAGTGISLSVGRSYDSLQTDSRDLGPGWTTGVGGDVRLRPYADGSVVYYGPGGSVVNFVNQNGTLQTPTGIDATLVHTGAGYTLSWHRSGQVDVFDSSGNLLSIRDKNGNTISFSYSGGLLSSITDSQNRPTTLAYDGNGRIATVTDPTGRTYQYLYDSGGNLEGYLDPTLAETTYSYDSLHRLTGIVTPGGRDTTIAYVGTTRQVASVTRVTNPATGAGDTTAYSYNTAGAATFCSGAASSTVVTSPDGNRPTYCFDTTGRGSKSEDPVGDTSSYLYNADSEVTRAISPNGGVTVNTYDGLFNLISSTASTGAKASYGFSDSSHPFYPTSVTDAQGNTTSYAYDANGNLTTVTDPLSTNNTVTHAYHTSSAPLGVETALTDPLGHVTSYGYDAVGNRTTTTPSSPLGPEHFTYDSLSRVATATDGKGQTRSYSYDALDRVTSVIYSDGSSVSYGYDPDGNLLSTVDTSAGQPAVTQNYAYDTYNRLTKTTDPGGNSVSNTYDGDGNLTGTNESGMTVTYAYDSADRVVAITDVGSTNPTRLTYDADGNALTVAYPNGVTVSNTYDLGDRLTRTTAAKGTIVIAARTYTYKNSAGTDTDVRTSVTDEAGNVTAYAYDALNRLTSAQMSSSAGVPNPGYNYQYQYDGASNRTAEVVNGVATQYTYNAANEVMAAGGTTYNYDADGNQTSPTTALGSANSTAAIYNAQNQLSAEVPSGAGAVAETYVGSGNADRLTSGTTTFTDSATATGTAAAASGPDPGAADPFTSGDTSGPTAPPQVDEAQGPNGTWYYTHDPSGGLIDELQTVGTNVTPYYYVLDGQGSVIALTDSSGSVSDRYSYDPFGTPTSTTGSVPNPWRYESGYYDPAAGYYELGARYYDPTTARFTQVDALTHANTASEINRYGFAGGDPVNAADPTGESKVVAAVYLAVLKQQMRNNGWTVNCVASCLSCVTDIVHKEYGHAVGECADCVRCLGPHFPTFSSQNSYAFFEGGGQGKPADPKNPYQHCP